MSNSEQPTTNNDLEGEPYVRIQFAVQNSEHGAYNSIYEMDCNVRSARISGLKQDFAGLFRIPEDRQSWTLNGILLNDDDSLLKYIAPDIDKEFTIRVTWR